MTIGIISDTRQKYVYDKRCKDIIIDASKTTTQSAVFNETIEVIGPWSDYTGSDNPNSSNLQMFGGVVNRFQGTTAQIEGHAKLGNLNEVGQNADITRRRLRQIYINISENK